MWKWHQQQWQLLTDNHFSESSFPSSPPTLDFNSYEFSSSSSPLPLLDLRRQFPHCSPRQPYAVSSMETSADFSVSRPQQTPAIKKPSGQQRKEQLQAEVSMLQKMLSHEEKIHAILQYLHDRKDGTPLNVPNFIPSEVKDLLVELAMVEEEIKRLENQIQQLQNDVNREQEATRELKLSKKCANGTTDQHDPAAGYSTLQQLISRNVTNTATSTNEKVGFETKALHFISKAINGNYSLNDFADKVASPLHDGNHHNRENENRFPKETSFQDRLIKRSGISKPSASPLRDFRHPTPKPKDRTNMTGTPMDLPRKSMSNPTSEETTNQGQKVLPNKLSENVIKCLILIYVRLMRTSRQIELEKSGPISRSMYSSLSFRADATGNNLSTSLILHKDSKQQDPYGVFNIEESIPRDIGPYKNLVVFSSSSLDPKCISNSSSIPLFQKLRGLLNSLQMVDLRSLSDQQKLAFWINMYNACIMHGYLQYGVPSSPEKLLSLMNKATLNIGGNIVNAQAIEHYILRKPSSSLSTTKETTGGLKGDKSGKEAIIRELYGLESPNPNMIFALSCGTRSSPAVRIYTSEGVISELEKSKLDYLQASISVTTTKRIALPELLTQNMSEFATDMESLVECVCNQLPTSGSLRKSIVDCFRAHNISRISTSSVINLPYEFEFQYLLAI